MPLITEKEKKKRTANVEAANFSVDLEGFVNTAENMELQKRYINGDINATELANIVKSRYGVSGN